MQNKSSYYLLRCLTALVVLQGVGQAQVLSLPEIRKGLEFERSKLQNGKFRAFGSISKNDASEGRVYKGQLELSCIFDHAIRSAVYTRRYPISRARIPDGVELPAGTKPRELSAAVAFSLYAMSGADAYYFSDRQLQKPYWLRIRDVKGKTPENCDVGFLDVRWLGFSTMEELEAGTSRGADVYFNHKRREGEVIVEMESESIARLSFSGLSGAFTDTVWIDCTNGFTPVRHTVEQGKRIESELLLAWEKNSDVWIPKSLRLTTSKYKLPKGSEPKEENFVLAETNIELSFAWEIVNAIGFKREVFDFRLFDLPEGTPIFDERVQPGKQIGVIAKNQTALSSKPSGRMYFVIALVVFACAGICYVCFCGRSR